MSNQCRNKICILLVNLCSSAVCNIFFVFSCSLFMILSIVSVLGLCLSVNDSISTSSIVSTHMVGCPIWAMNNIYWQRDCKCTAGSSAHYHWIWTNVHNINLPFIYIRSVYFPLIFVTIITMEIIRIVCIHLCHPNHMQTLQSPHTHACTTMYCTNCLEVDAVAISSLQCDINISHLLLSIYLSLSLSTPLASMKTSNAI